MNVTRSRRMNLALLIWTGLAVAWVVINYVRLFSARCGSLEDSVFGAFEEGAFSESAVCFDIAAHGGRLATALDFAIRVGIIWAVGIGVLAAIWFIVRDRGPASASVTVASVPAVAVPAAAPAAAPSTPPEGWYGDSERPGHTRWWNGSAWGMRDDEHSSPAAATPSTDVVGAGGAPAPDDAELVTAAVATPVESSPEAAPAAASSFEPAPSPAQESPVRFCENCGAQRSPTGKFCTACGHA